MRRAVEEAAVIRAPAMSAAPTVRPLPTSCEPSLRTPLGAQLGKVMGWFPRGPAAFIVPYPGLEGSSQPDPVE